jgi:hypothetical protein
VCSAYEIATGRAPFRATSWEDLLAKHIFKKPSSAQVFNQKITDELGDLVARILGKQREDRRRDFHKVLM